MGQRCRRPWFQIHLSTALVLMIAWGGLIWANMRDQVPYNPPIDQYDPHDLMSHRTPFLKNPFPKYGFPFVCVDMLITAYGDVLYLFTALKCY